MNKHLLSIVLSGALLLSPLVARAQTTGPIGQIISYQGQLTGTNGAPIADGTQSLSFSIQEAGSDTALFSTTQSVVTVGGVFNTFLGVGSLALDPTKSYTLSVTFNGGTTTHPIAAVPVAMSAVSATTAANVSGVVPIANGGTGSATKNFVDTTTAQTVNGAKTFGSALVGQNSLLLSGSTGATPVSGAGTRMMWVPAKSAFRAGYVDGTQWDNLNIGISSMALGSRTTASGLNAVALGSVTTASDENSIAMGASTTASGLNSTAMGYNTTASGSFTTAMGSYASTNGQRGSFVYSDASTTSVVSADVTNQAVWRTSGGFKIYSNAGLTAGVNLAAGSGSWSSLSDRNAKDKFSAISSRDVLRRVSALPLSSWQYKGNSSRHIGPMAQDFRAAFGLGPDEKHIDTVDADGVAFAAIQGLNSELQDTKTELQDTKTQLRDRDAKLAAFEARLKKLESGR